MPWLMFLPFIVVIHGKPQRQMLSPLLYQDGRCYCHFFIHIFVADVKPHDWHVTATEDSRFYCQVVDGIATAGWVTGRCYYQVGRCYSHRSIVLFYFEF